MANYFNVHADPTARISPKASILGDVTIGSEATIFGGAYIRGDMAPVRIGANSNVQECVAIHVDADYPCTVGDNVTIGHGAVVHGCTIADNCLVGMGSVVMNGAVIGEGCLIAAGALVSQGKEYLPRTLIMGVPARAVRTISEEEYQTVVLKGAHEYLEVGREMVEQGAMFNPGPDFRGQA